MPTNPEETQQTKQPSSEPVRGDSEHLSSQTAMPVTDAEPQSIGRVWHRRFDAVFAWGRRAGTIYRQPDNPIWSIAAVTFGLIALYYTFIIWYRWGRPDPEFLSFSVNILQLVSFLSLLGVLTTVGDRLVRETWRKLTTSYSWLHHPRTAGLSALLLALLTLFGFYVGLPVRADYLNTQGEQAIDQGHYNLAVQNLRRAVSLAPEHAGYHYNLGRAYASANAFMEAQQEFQHALDRDDSFWPVYNELALLHLRPGYDPETALIYALAGNNVLAQLAASSAYPTDALLVAKGIIQRDIGHAYLTMELPQPAIKALDEAVTLFDTYTQTTGADGDVGFYQAEIHRLRALAYEARQMPETAHQSWLNSVAFALPFSNSSFCHEQRGLTHPNCLLVQKWLAEAAERLDQD